jgi:hypothetical protein
MNYLIGGLLAALIVYTLTTRPTMKDHWQMGYEAGKKEALKTSPPSEELEMVCAGLWVGQQNKKFWERENGRKH